MNAAAEPGTVQVMQRWWLGLCALACSCGGGIVRADASSDDGTDEAIVDATPRDGARDVVFDTSPGDTLVAPDDAPAQDAGVVCEALTPMTTREFLVMAPHPAVRVVIPPRHLLFADIGNGRMVVWDSCDRGVELAHAFTSYLSVYHANVQHAWFYNAANTPRTVFLEEDRSYTTFPYSEVSISGTVQEPPSQAFCETPQRFEVGTTVHVAAPWISPTASWFYVVTVPPGASVTISSSYIMDGGHIPNPHPSPALRIRRNCVDPPLREVGFSIVSGDVWHGHFSEVSTVLPNPDSVAREFIVEVRSGIPLGVSAM
jgi:hypothetical protein